MNGSGHWQRDVLFAALGLAAGLAVAAFRVAPSPAEDGKKLARTLPAVSRAAARQADSPELPARHRRGAGRGDATANGQSDWAQAAAEYRAPDGSITRARAFLYRLDAKGLRKLAQDAATWPPGRRTLRALRDIFQQWARLDPGDALAAAQTLPPEQMDTAVWSVINGFAETQPAQAAAFLAVAPGPRDGNILSSLSTRRLMLGSALMAWSEQDGPAAASFLEGLPGQSVSSYIAARVAEEWTRQDPAAALNWALRLGDKTMHAEAVQGVLSTWAATDPQAAANRMLTLSNEPGQEAAAGTLTEAWARLDLPAAARWAAGQSGAIGTKAVTAVAVRWADQDPAGAAAWAGQLPAGAARDGAYANVATGWADRDPAAAQGWLNGLPPGSERDAAFAEYSGSWQNSSQPAEMLGWAGRIDNPQKRDDAMVAILKRWTENQPQDARRWISQANLPSTVLNQLPKAATQAGG